MSVSEVLIWKNRALWTLVFLFCLFLFHVYRVVCSYLHLFPDHPHYIPEST